MTERAVRLPAWAAVMSGLVGGAVAFAVAFLVAGLVDARAFPVLAVGDAIVDLSPAWLKNWAIAQFGEYDKVVLLTCVSVVLAGFAAGLGLAARRRIAYAVAGVVLLGVVGAWAVLSRPGATAAGILPTAVGTAVGAWTLSWLVRRAMGAPAAGDEAARREAAGREAAGGAAAGGEAAGHDAGEAGEAGRALPYETPPREPERPAVIRPGRSAGFDRRRLLQGAAGGLVVAGAAGVAGRVLTDRMAVSGARESLRLPRPALPAPPLPAGVDLRLNGLSPFVTPNDDFYRVDTALIVPQVDPRVWSLRVHGLVERPIILTFGDLLRRPLLEADITLACVSNEVGGPLVGNARWLGARLSDLLREARVRRGADMLLSTSADGWTCGTPIDVVMDGRDSLLAVGMNGVPLPQAHGFPVRQVVPGLYGYVSATKWIVDIKVTKFTVDQAYWTPRGWAERAPVKTQSRIDVPAEGAKVKPGRTAVAGVAWAQHRGIDAVEVRVDGGPWHVARLAQAPTADTWRQWVFEWDATPGSHTIEVRATDGTGHTQTSTQAPPVPDGATGWHSRVVSVSG
ncbi:molybdopterin-dependent oxidoreductase [Sinosporangium siamense]|uniref:Oxidoreductase n=1 Tax=Sinosporangium siamense TaxID=1367973 RepID=A0A919RCC0_9ACTN|nr:molybdopterin-dependent oxidoreductase [Sinosporangium siamense]GII91326.1 oxidoreductase [Sinosporangium siamense]